MKKALLLVLLLFMTIGCSMANSPTSLVEGLLGKYQRLDQDIKTEIEELLDTQDLTSEHRERYRKLLSNQYKNIAYEIKNESIDGNIATVTTQIEVIDYRNAISDLTYDGTIYTKETYDEEKLQKLENTNEKVTYTIDFIITKDDMGNWKLNGLTNEQISKIQGMY